MRMKEIRSGVSREYSQAHAHDSYDKWCETCWDEFQDVVKQLDTLNLTPQEREFHRMLIEQDYLNKLRNFMFAKTSWKSITDEDSLAMFEKLKSKLARSSWQASCLPDLRFAKSNS